MPASVEASFEFGEKFTQTYKAGFNEKFGMVWSVDSEGESSLGLYWKDLDRVGAQYLSFSTDSKGVLSGETSGSFDDVTWRFGASTDGAGIAHIEVTSDLNTYTGDVQVTPDGKGGVSLSYYDSANQQTIQVKTVPSVDGINTDLQYTFTGEDGSSYTVQGGSSGFKIDISGTNAETNELGTFSFQLGLDGSLKYEGSSGGATGSSFWSPEEETAFKDFLGAALDAFLPASAQATEFDDGFKALLEAGFNTAEITRSPLILDLDGDGVETTSESQGVYFDLDANGFREHSAWAGKDDGLLVWDRNSNGQIDNGSELFGNNTLLSSGEKAANGFLALADLDENKDGVFDARDSTYAKLSVWNDRNSDGAVQEGELYTLEQAQVASISLNFLEPGKLDANGEVPSAVVDGNGNEHRQTGNYTRTDGLVRSVNDVWFDVDGKNTVDGHLIQVSAEINALPELEGFGNVHSLRQAMARDSSGKLEGLVKAFAIEDDASQRQNIVLEIIYRWAGVEGLDPNGRSATQIYGNVIGDARKLATLEAFLGENYLGTWCWGTRDPNPHGPAAAILLQSFDNLMSAVYGKLMIQTHFSSLFAGVNIGLTESGVVLDVSSIVSKLKTQFDADQDAGVVLITEFGKSISELGSFGLDLIDQLQRAPGVGDPVFDSLLGALGKQGLLGGSGNDVLNGTAEDDSLYGFGGDDRIYGGGGNDHLSGGTGEDYLAGGDGADVYEFGRGDGKDTVFNADQDVSGSKIDKLLFGPGITAADIIVRRNYYDLILEIKGTSDSVTVQSYFDEDTVANHGYAVDQIVFADGSFWTIDQVKTIVQRPTDGNDVIWGDASINTLKGGLGDDKLYGLANDDLLDGDEGQDLINGGDGNDVLAGGEGDDSLHGGIGNDVLVGGAGNDYLEGGEGSDTYRFGRNWGQDTINNLQSGTEFDSITFTDGIVPEDIILSQSGTDLVVSLRGSTDRLTIKYYFEASSGPSYRLQQVNFSDGTVWSPDFISTMAQNGFEGDDLLPGTAVADSLVGGVGNDTLHGQGGNDSLRGDDGGDTLYGDGGDDIIHGGSGNDTLDGGTGKNQLFGDAGDDVIQVAYNSTDNTLAGGTGNDMLTGSYFSDTYFFNLGDGQDTISEYDPGYDATDILRFGEGILASDMVMRRTGSDLVFMHRNGSDQVTLKAVFDRATSDGSAVTSAVVERIEFADGTFWTWSDMVAAGLSQTGTTGADALVGFNGNDNIHAGAGNDTLDGGAGTNQLFGDAGDDVIRVAYNSRDNMLAGGIGNDTLTGGYFSDTYLFNLGDGHDIITEYDAGNVAIDTLRFGDGILASDIVMRRVGYDLVFLHRNGSDQVTVKEVFDRDTSAASAITSTLIERIEFADGTAWTWSDMVAAGLSQTGTAGADALVGFNGSDIIHGGEGNDTLDGGAGSNQLFGDAGDDVLQVAYDARNNTLAGGTGNDTLTGSGYSDTYLFNLGDGQDTILERDPGTGMSDTLRFGTGIAASDIIMRRIGSDLVFLHLNGTDQVTVKGWFDGITSGVGALTSSVIERVEFADGTLWTWPELAATGFSQTGTAQADVLVGFNGSDIIHGGEGNDTLDGGAGSNQLFGDAGDDVIQVAYDARNNTLAGGTGNDTLTGSGYSDTYLFNLGDGQDTILERDPGTGAIDILRFGAGILADDIQAYKSGTDVVFMHNNGVDQITVKGWFDGPTSDAGTAFANIIERVEFADGSFWTATDIAAKGFGQVGTASGEVLVGGLGNDNIHGGDGNDTLDGGAGTNRLYGDAGDDVVKVASDSRNNTLAGGTGNDTLIGSGYSDTYLFNLGDGQDTISERDPGTGMSDTLRFGTGIAASDIIMRRIGSDLVFLHLNGTDQVTVKGWFDGITSGVGALTSSVIERVEFADGTVWTWPEMAVTGLSQTGTAQADVLVGFNGSDIIHGGNGNDALDGGAGSNQLFGDAGDDVIQVASDARNNTLAGGTGNDTLIGSGYSDTYLFNLGDGQDTISERDPGTGTSDTLRFGTGIAASDIIMRRTGSDLVFLHLNGTDQVTVKGWFDGSTSGSSAITSNIIERVAFADGTVWTWPEMAATGLNQTGTAQVDALVGFNGSDIIHGGEGNDTLDGGAGSNQLFGDAGDDVIQVASDARNNVLAGGTGNDTLIGSGYSDTYLFNLGDGQDTISERDPGTGAIDILRFGAGILADDIQAYKSGTDVIFKHNNGVDQITVKGGLDRVTSDAVAATQSMLERVEFADGTFWNSADIAARGLNQIGTAEADVLVGWSGNDIIYSGSGDDNLDGGAGSNRLFGDAGNDVIRVAPTSRNNTLAGGAGNDTLSGSYFSDTYLFNEGDGKDIIAENDAGNVATDILRFGPRILASDIFIRRSGSDLLFSHRNGNDQVTVKGWFDGVVSSNGAVTASVIERVEFDDGTLWTWTDMVANGLNQTGTGEGDVLLGWSGNDIIHGGDKDDILDGGTGTNQLFGDAGNDVIKVASTSRNNTLSGGAGDDTLIGGYYSDTYLFELGDGQDTITENDPGYGGIDSLRFGAGIVANDIIMRRSGSDLLFLHRNGTDQVTVKDWFDGRTASGAAITSNTIERVEFADGTLWTWAEMAAAGFNQTGTAGADTLIGFNGSDIIHGGSGNDTLDGGAGTNQLFGDAGDDVVQVAYNSRDNTLAGGTGNDTLTGGYFSDTYLFNLGDGEDAISEYDPGYGAIDTLRFGSGIQASDILMRRTGSDLTFLHRNGTDQMTVKGLFDGVASNTSYVSQNVIERVEFADGTYWTWSDMIATGLNQTGTDNADAMLGWNGNDIIHGGSGDDTLDAAGGTNQLFGDAGNDLIQVATNSRDNLLVGGTGNDTLTGGYFSDTYVFNLGDGQDTISEYDPGYGGIDTLRFGAGILASDIQAYKSGADVVFMHSNGIDQVKVKGWFDGTTSSASVVTQSVLERVEFADGTAWALADIAAKGLRQVGTAGADSLSGSNGNDNIYGGAGNDVLDGGAGTNRLFGEAGNDVIQVSSNSRDNTLAGGAGNDTLTGGYFADTYLFNRGDGQDTVNEYDPGYGMSDTLAFGTDLNPQDLWFRKSGSDLEISIVGGDEKLTVSNWYQGSVYHLEALKLSDGKTLLDSQVQSLVDTMASFGVAPGAETTITTDQRAQLDSVLAANWK